MILDHIDNLTLPDNHGFGNEIAVLRSLMVGLAYLNAQVARIEKKVARQYPSNMRVFSYGNDPCPKWIPKDMIFCAFHWYAVSACNYASLVGWLAKQAGAPDKPAEYVKAVIPAVVMYRNKVAAHFAKVSPKDDNEATLDVSVLPSVAWDDDAFYVGMFKMTKTVRGVRSSSPDFRWSLTKTHSALAMRYWPGAGCHTHAERSLGGEAPEAPRTQTVR